MSLYKFVPLSNILFPTEQISVFFRYLLCLAVCRLTFITEELKASASNQ
jgi:hypothetical protein